MSSGFPELPGIASYAFCQTFLTQKTPKTPKHGACPSWMHPAIPLWLLGLLPPGLPSALSTQPEAGLFPSPSPATPVPLLVTLVRLVAALWGHVPTTSSPRGHWEACGQLSPFPIEQKKPHTAKSHSLSHPVRVSNPPRTPAAGFPPPFPSRWAPG